MPMLFHRVILTAPLVFWAGTAQATFICEVLPTLTGIVHLRAEPAATAPSLMPIPAGAFVSLFTQEGDSFGAWVRIAYAQDDDPQWGAGVTGWVLNSQLGDCG